jgi:hypothetical protein
MGYRAERLTYGFHLLRFNIKLSAASISPIFLVLQSINSLRLISYEYRGYFIGSSARPELGNGYTSVGIVYKGASADRSFRFKKESLA